jgi:hypothetical protein
MRLTPSRARSTATALVLLALGAAGAASCDSATALTPDGGTGTGGAGGAPPVVYAPGCPGDPGVPQDGACAPPQVCEYRASDAHPTCVTRLECYAPSNGVEPTWHLTTPDPTCAKRPASCPSSYALVMQGGLCALQDVACDYDQGRCGCLPCGTGTLGVWSCRAWNTGGQGCPAVSPLAGTACATEAQFCTYGGVCSISVGENLQCTHGFWQRFSSATGSCIMRTCP